MSEQTNKFLLTLDSPKDSLKNFILNNKNNCKIILQKLTIRPFRKIKFLELNFDQELTEIFAPNGSGKSSVIDAIYFLFTGFDSKGNKPITDGRFILKSQSKELINENYDITLEFQVEETFKGSENKKIIEYKIRRYKTSKPEQIISFKDSRGNWIDTKYNVTDYYNYINSNIFRIYNPKSLSLMSNPLTLINSNAIGRKTAFINTLQNNGVEFDLSQFDPKVVENILNWNNPDSKFYKNAGNISNDIISQYANDYHPDLEELRKEHKRYMNQFKSLDKYLVNFINLRFKEIKKNKQSSEKITKEDLFENFRENPIKDENILSKYDFSISQEEIKKEILEIEKYSKVKSKYLEKDPISEQEYMKIYNSSLNYEKVINENPNLEKENFDLETLKNQKETLNLKLKELITLKEQLNRQLIDEKENNLKQKNHYETALNDFKLLKEELSKKTNEELKLEQIFNFKTIQEIESLNNFVLETQNSKIDYSSLISNIQNEILSIKSEIQKVNSNYDFKSQEKVIEEKQKRFNQGLIQRLNSTILTLEKDKNLIQSVNDDQDLIKIIEKSALTLEINHGERFKNFQEEINKMIDLLNQKNWAERYLSIKGFFHSNFSNLFNYLTNKEIKSEVSFEKIKNSFFSINSKGEKVFKFKEFKQDLISFLNSLDSQNSLKDLLLEWENNSNLDNQNYLLTSLKEKHLRKIKEEILSILNKVLEILKQEKLSIDLIEKELKIEQEKLKSLNESYNFQINSIFRFDKLRIFYNQFQFLRNELLNSEELKLKTFKNSFVENEILLPSSQKIVKNESEILKIQKELSKMKIIEDNLQILQEAKSFNFYQNLKELKSELKDGEFLNSNTHLLNKFLNENYLISLKEKRKSLSSLSDDLDLIVSLLNRDWDLMRKINKIQYELNLVKEIHTYMFSILEKQIKGFDEELDIILQLKNKTNNNFKETFTFLVNGTTELENASGGEKVKVGIQFAIVLQEISNFNFPIIYDEFNLISGDLKLLCQNRQLILSSVDRHNNFTNTLNVELFEISDLENMIYTKENELNKKKKSEEDFEEIEWDDVNFDV